MPRVPTVIAPVVLPIDGPDRWEDFLTAATLASGIGDHNAADDARTEIRTLFKSEHIATGPLLRSTLQILHRPQLLTDAEHVGSVSRNLRDETVEVSSDPILSAARSASDGIRHAHPYYAWKVTPGAF